MNKSSQNIHFIAIGGSVMHHLAIALKKEGHLVTGSDDGFFDPSETNLKKHGLLPPQEGWFSEKIHSGLNAVVLGMHAREDNPELKRAQELGLKIYSFPEYILEHSRDKQRIVIAGSHGKTTITSIILHILKHNNRSFDYLVGAELEGFDGMVKISDAPVIIIEGDEYSSSPLDKTPKILNYHHHIGLISGIAWDHMNVFPTEESYVKQFEMFADATPKGGSLVMCEEDDFVTIIANKQREDVNTLMYGIHPYRNINGQIVLKSAVGEVPVQIFGEHNMQNISGAYQVCKRIGITDQQFYAAIGSFKGAAKRMQLLKKNDSTIIYRDFAHAPSKVEASVKALKDQYPQRKLIACLELHTFSSLNKEFLPQYQNTISSADVPVVYFNPKVVELFNDSEPIDLLTVTNRLRKRSKLELSGGPFFITELTSRVNSAANIEFHARVISEMAIKRRLIKIAGEIQRDAYEDSNDVFELLDKTESALFEVSESNIRKNYADMRSIMRDAIAELEAKKSHTDGLTGVPSGFSALDRVTSGWQKSDLIIIAARPAMGKTAFVVSAMRNAAVEFGKGVAIFSLEMSAVQLVNRMISAEAELESEKIKKGNLADYEWEQLVHKTARLTEAPIFIDDTPALSVLELRAKCRRLKAQHDIQMIIIDYLQLMSGDSSKMGGAGKGNREQEIASISRALKNLAKELSVPVIALSQLSRAVETRGGDKRPQLSDLRESGSIEQDTDMVMFLYRPEYYGIMESEEGMPLAGVGEVIIAKHRNGSLDTVQLKFVGKYTRFSDLDGQGPTSIGMGNYSPVSSLATTAGGTMTFGSKVNNGEKSDNKPGFGYTSFPEDDEAPF